MIYELRIEATKDKPSQVVGPFNTPNEAYRYARDNKVQGCRLYPAKQDTFRCDQCEAAMVNGVFCHETGCPNSRKTWAADRQEWVRFLECLECGSEVEAGEQCTCAEVV